MQLWREGLTVSQFPPDNQARGTTPDAESEMPSRRYSIAEAAQALDVTTQSLQRWLRTTDTDIKSERDAVERRLRWLNQAQVTELSRRHHRGELRPISRIEQHLVARLRDCERRIEELEAWRDQQMQSGTPLAPLEPYTPRPPRTSSQTRPLGAVTSLDPVPEGWVPLSTFAERIGISRRTLTSAVRRRSLTSHRGEWQTLGPNPVRTTEILDPDEQEAARAYYRK